MEVNELLSYLVTGGSVVVANWGASWLLEDTEFWHKLTSKARKNLILLFSVVVALLAQVALANPEFVALVEPYFQTIIFAVAGWLSSQAAHNGNPFRS